MPTTSNFGWTTPADTDLVKDGAAAIRTLGNGIDTSFLDLKGGTTDQVLAKNSNTDLDFKWVAQDDSNAIQNTIVDAKGDLISATAADVPARLAVGTNGYVLTADSAEATGLKWAAPAAGGKVLQVVNTILTAGSFSTTSSSYVDVTNANVTITPATTGSRIMIFCSTVGGAYAASGSGNCDLRLAIVRTSTIVNEYRFDLENNTGSSTSLNTIITPYYLDSPSTTSATTYKIQIKKVNFSDSVQVTANTTNKFILTAMEIGA